MPETDIEILIATNLPPFCAGPLEQRYVCHHLPRAEDRDTLIGSVAGRVRAIASNGHGPVTAAMIDALPRVEIISCFGVGIDGVDWKHAQGKNIPVTNTPDVLTDCVADVAMGLTLCCLREMVVADRFVRSGDWRKGGLRLATKVGGRRMGIVGLGRIGEAIARRAAAHGMQVAYHNRRRKDVPYAYYDDLARLAAESDVLCIACPGGPETRHLVDAGVLRALGAEGWLVNISRGTVVDEAALVAALQDGTIRGAGLDVFEHEPNVPEALLGLENVVLLPHIGSATHETRQEMANLTIGNLAAHFSGRPLLSPFY